MLVATASTSWVRSDVGQKLWRSSGRKESRIILPPRNSSSEKAIQWS